MNRLLRPKGLLYELNRKKSGLPITTVHDDMLNIENREVYDEKR